MWLFVDAQQEELQGKLREHFVHSLIYSIHTIRHLIRTVKPGNVLSVPKEWPRSTSDTPSPLYPHVQPTIQILLVTKYHFPSHERLLLII